MERRAQGGPGRPGRGKPSVRVLRTRSRGWALPQLWDLPRPQALQRAAGTSDPPQAQVLVPVHALQLSSCPSPSLARRLPQQASTGSEAQDHQRETTEMDMGKELGWVEAGRGGPT